MKKYRYLADFDESFFSQLWANDVA